MLIPVHSPWPPGYIDVTQTVLIILTMAGLFPDRPHVLSIYLCVHSFKHLFSTFCVPGTVYSGSNEMRKKMALVLRSFDIGNKLFGVAERKDLFFLVHGDGGGVLAIKFLIKKKLKG